MTMPTEIYPRNQISYFKASGLNWWLFFTPWLIVLFTSTAFSQNSSQHVDSLATELNLASSDAERIRIHHEIASLSDPDTALIHSRKALNLAEQAGDSKLVVMCLSHLGTLYSKMSNYSEAHTVLTRAVDIGITDKLYAQLTDAYLALGIVFLRQHHLDSAHNTLNKGLAMARQNADQRSIGLMYNVLGNVAKEENDFTLASDYYIRATTIFEKHGSKEDLAQGLSNIGNIQNVMGNYDKAERYALQSLEVAEKANTTSSIAYVNGLLGRIYRKQGRYDEALKRYSVASDLYQKRRAKRESGEINTNIGNIYFELGKFNRALEYYYNAIKIKKSISDSAGIAYDFNAAAGTFNRIGKVDLAIRYLDSAMFFAEKKHIMPLLMDAYSMKSEIYVGQKQYRLAYDNFVSYSSLKDSLAALRNNEASDELEAKYQSEKKEREIAALHAENQISSLQLETQRAQRVYLIGVSLLSLLLIAVLYNRYRIKQRSAEKLKQLDTTKSRFFANISHEFRTPLSLIAGPLQKALVQPEAAIPQTDIEMMYRNASRLQILINQLLDLSRIESGKMKLHLVKTDIARMVKTLCSAFQSRADQRNIGYQVLVNDDIGSGYVDEDKLEKIIFNLVSNAFKFTADGGSIVVKVSNGSKLIISVRDNGIGIPASHIARIFDRFYQVDDSTTRVGEGTGIGLSLAKELAAVHHGSLGVESKEGEGSEFVLTIPVDRANYQPEDFALAPAENGALYSWQEEIVKADTQILDEIENEDLPLILIAEDNRDMRSFIRDILKSEYRIVEAEDGVHAWKKTQEIIPDLIITDLMMPRMDGTAFCEKLRKTLATSHIPVVMLTAKAGQESKIDGLQRGADDYLVKPFDVKELKVRVHNLVEQRKKLRERYRQEITLQPADVSVTSADAEFLQKVLATLEENFSASDFGVEEFNRAIGFSRMQSHRKLKALTDQSTGEFIKHFRLEKAKQYLAFKGAQVSQVAYDCGFNNLSHFSKSFKDHTGMTPSEFVAKMLMGVELKK